MDTTVQMDLSKADVARQAELPNKYNAPIGLDPNFNGPLSTRSCTDTCWILIFLLANLALAALSTYSYWAGDPNRLVHGWDFRAELCGEGGLATKPYTYFPDLVNSPRLSLCLEGCPILASSAAVCLYNTDHATDIPSIPCYDAYPSKPFANRYCLPSDAQSRNILVDWLYEVSQVMTRTTGDLYRAWDVLAISGVVSVLVLFFYLIWLNIGKLLSILGVLSFAALTILLAGLCFLIYEEATRISDDVCGQFGNVPMKDCDGSIKAGPYKTLSWSTAGLSLCVAVVALLSLPQVCRGPRFVSLSMRPLKRANCLLLVPCIVLLMGAGIFSLLITLAAYLASCGSIQLISQPNVEGGEIKEIAFRAVERFLIIYDVLMVFWWFSLVAHITEYLTSSYAAFWFFGKDKTALPTPFRSSVKNLLRYHLGSMILASVALPLFRFPRYIFSLLRHSSKRLGIDGNRCCSSCCGLCFDSYDGVLRYMDSPAIAYQSLWGRSFCDSARCGFFLLERDKGTCRKLLSAGNFYVWLFQVVVTLTAPVFVFYWVQHNDQTFRRDLTKHISSVTGLACVSLFLSWNSAQVLGGYVRGLLHGGVVSYLSDNEMFVGNQRFADRQLIALFTGEEIPPAELSQRKSKKEQESMQEFLYEQPVKSNPPVTLERQVIPPSPITSSLKTEEHVRPVVQRTEAPQSARFNAFELPPNRPMLDILRQTQSSASSGISSTPSEMHMFVPPNVVPPASPKESRHSKDAKQESKDSVRNLRAPVPELPRNPVAEDSDSDSMSSYSDSEEEADVNRRPIARPSSRGEAQARRNATLAKGRKPGARKG